MKETRITIPELALVAGTRGALGAGLGLLLGERLSGEQRRAAGWTLILIGVLTTIPLAFEIFGKSRLRRVEGLSRDSGQPGGGRGRTDRTGIIPEGIRVDPYVTEGHPGYDESGPSEIIPQERLSGKGG